MTDQEGWGITNLQKPVIDSGFFGGLSVEVEEDNMIAPEEALYWIAPFAYLGNKVSFLIFFVCLHKRCKTVCR